MTDCYKIYSKCYCGNPTNKIKAFKDQLIHKTIFEEEIKIIKPNCIVALGNNVCKFLNVKLSIKISKYPIVSSTASYYGIPVIPMVHLSPNNIGNGSIRSFLKVNGCKHMCPAEEIPKEYASLV